MYMIKYICIYLSHHVFDSCLEVAEEGFGLMSLHLTVLDGLSPQVVVHLDSENGRRASLILAAGITCAGGRADPFREYIPPLIPVLPDRPARAAPGGRSRPETLTYLLFLHLRSIIFSGSTWN